MTETGGASLRAPLPSESEIRAMEGPALCRLAWELGLTPPKTWYNAHASYPFWIGNQGRQWRPHEKVEQADAVFRSLRTRGWTISSVSGTTRFLVCAIRWAADGSMTENVSIRQDIQPGAMTEAHALLLCAVLAVARERGQEGVHL